jgi:hypothetical protein
MKPLHLFMAMIFVVMTLARARSIYRTPVAPLAVAVIHLHGLRRVSFSDARKFVATNPGDWVIYEISGRLAYRITIDD